MVRLSLCLLVLCALACQSAEYDRIIYEDDALSIRHLDWALQRERDALVFSSPDERSTIALRSAPLAGPAPQLDSLVRATSTVLGGLVEASVSAPRAVEHRQLAAAAFDLSFVPPRRRERYERRHVVLLGTRHMYHAILTAPAGHLSGSAELFDDVVASLREE